MTQPAAPPGSGEALPGARACAAIVMRDDPRLHATALFAPEPARSELMVLYAFDIELSRAAQPSTEPLIPRIRLQWWRDVVEAVRGGAAPPAHEVAGPFARLVVERDLPPDLVEGLISAREAELGGDFDAARFVAWADARFGALAALAAHLLTGGDVASTALARRAGPVLGAAFVLRHAVAMAHENRFILPGLAAADRTALARGEANEGVRVAVQELAGPALAGLAELRALRGRADRRATSAFLPLVWAERVLGRAARAAPSSEAEGRSGRAAPSFGLFRRAAVGLGDLDGVDRPFDGLRLALRAAAGRW